MKVVQKYSREEAQFKYLYIVAIGNGRQSWSIKYEDLMSRIQSKYEHKYTTLFFRIKLDISHMSKDNVFQVESYIDMGT